MFEQLIRQAVNNIKDYTPGKNPSQPGVVKLASNENPFGPSPLALAAIAKEAKNLHIYPDQKSLALRAALAKQLNLHEDNVIIGNGSDEIMQLAAATFLKPGEEVLIPGHTFSLYETFTHLFDGQPVVVDLKDKEQDLAAMAKAITQKTKLIFLCNPHNPTGTMISAANLASFLTSVPENVLVILDEAYVEFADAKDFPNTLALVKELPNVLVLRTFSKYFGLAGLRVGYGLASTELVKYMFRVKPPFNVNRLAQAGALAALEDKTFLEQTYKNNLKGRDYLFTELDKLGLEYKKTQANFVFIKVKQPADELFLQLMKQGVIVRPLTSFGLPEAIRVSIGTKEQNKKFIQALALQKAQAAG